MDTQSFFEQAATITKAHAYDILAEQIENLKAENEKLKEENKYLQNLIKTYTDKMLSNLK